MLRDETNEFDNYFNDSNEDFQNKCNSRNDSNFHFEFESSELYLEDELIETVKIIAGKAKKTFKDQKNGITNYTYIDGLVNTAISSILQITIYLAYRKMYEKGFLK